jgi:hypothetical protein
VNVNSVVDSILINKSMIYKEYGIMIE